MYCTPCFILSNDELLHLLIFGAVFVIFLVGLRNISLLEHTQPIAVVLHPHIHTMVVCIHRIICATVHCLLCQINYVLLYAVNLTL